MRWKWLCLLWAAALSVTGCAAHLEEIKKDSVLLYLNAPEAHSVHVGVFYDVFELRTAIKDRRGFWVAQMPKDRQFSYFFLVDGVPRIPDCQFKEMDDFGQTNCVFSPPRNLLQ